MRVTRIAVIAITALAVSSCAESPTGPVLPERVVGVPPGWRGTIGPSRYYEIGLLRDQHFSGHSAVYLDGQPNFTSEFAYIDQPVRADLYRGKRVRLSAWVKSQDIQGPIAGLWMRVDGPGVITGFDNMFNRPLKGTTSWHQVSIVLDVPLDAIGIVIGAMLHGGGPLYSGFMLVDEMKLEVVDKSVPSTNTYEAPVANGVDPAATFEAYAKATIRPTNLDFERIP